MLGLKCSELGCWVRQTVYLKGYWHISVNVPSSWGKFQTMSYLASLVKFCIVIVHFQYIKIYSWTKGMISRHSGTSSYKSLYLFPRASRWCLLFRTEIWSIQSSFFVFQRGFMFLLSSEEVTSFMKRFNFLLKRNGQDPPSTSGQTLWRTERFGWGKARQAGRDTQTLPTTGWNWRFGAMDRRKRDCGGFSGYRTRSCSSGGTCPSYLITFKGKTNNLREICIVQC